MPTERHAPIVAPLALIQGLAAAGGGQESMNTQQPPLRSLPAAASCPWGEVVTTPAITSMTATISARGRHRAGRTCYGVHGVLDTGIE